jgi:hypothetical protein
VDENEVAASLLEMHGPAGASTGRPRCLQVKVAASGQIRAEVRPEPEGWLGQNLPAGWEAAALVATGRVRSTDETCELPGSLARARAGGLRLCCLVSRSGGIGWKAELPDPEGPVPFSDPGSHHPLSRAPEEGRVLDVLLRAAGLPTAAPRSATAELFCLLWIERLLNAAVTSAAPRAKAQWPDAVGLHPALALDPGTDADEAESVFAALGASQTWEDIRQRAIHLDTSGFLPTARLASWMDEGIFSRWVMDSLPPLDQALRLVRPHLSPVAYHRLRRLSRQQPGAGDERVPG